MTSTISLILQLLQPQVKESVSKFMAYIHMSVNDKSKEYQANERRYNYTTPKSFLEQIKLYRSLLGQKRKDLTVKMERLENGLTKLNSTSAQVWYSSPNSKLLINNFSKRTFAEECKKKPNTRFLATCAPWLRLSTLETQVMTLMMPSIPVAGAKLDIKPATYSGCLLWRRKSYSHCEQTWTLPQNKQEQ